MKQKCNVCKTSEAQRGNEEAPIKKTRNF